MFASYIVSKYMQSYENLLHRENLIIKNWRRRCRHEREDKGRVEFN